MIFDAIVKDNFVKFLFPVAYCYCIEMQLMLHRKTGVFSSADFVSYDLAKLIY